MKNVDGAVSHSSHPSPHAVLAQARRVFPVLTTVLHRDDLSLAPSAGDMKRLKVSASALALEVDGENLRLSAPGGASCWFFESRTK